MEEDNPEATSFIKERRATTGTKKRNLASIHEGEEKGPNTTSNSSLLQTANRSDINNSNISKRQKRKETKTTSIPQNGNSLLNGTVTMLSATTAVFTSPSPSQHASKPANEVEDSTSSPQPASPPTMKSTNDSTSSHHKISNNNNSSNNNNKLQSPDTAMGMEDDEIEKEEITADNNNDEIDEIMRDEPQHTLQIIVDRSTNEQTDNTKPTRSVIMESKETEETCQSPSLTKTQGGLENGNPSASSSTPAAQTTTATIPLIDTNHGSGHYRQNSSSCLETKNETYPTTRQRRSRRGRKRRCTGCSSSQEPDAVVWCCDCYQSLCLLCDERKHNNDGLDQKLRPMASHRVEYIIDNDIPLLTTILELTICVGVTMAVPCFIFWNSSSSHYDCFRTNLIRLFGNHTMATSFTTTTTTTPDDLEDYLFNSTCPAIEKIRRWIFWLDHALLPLVKGILGNWCDIEDSFWKMFSDLWMRGILTKTDSFALILMKLPSAINALIIMLVLTPILLGIPYAIVATAIRIVELILVPNWTLVHYITRMSQFLTWIVCIPWKISIGFCLGTVIGLLFTDNQDDGSSNNNCTIFLLPQQQQQQSLLVLPPKTGHRKRPVPSHGIFDISITGSLSRITRIFRYFHRTARRIIIRTILSSVFLTFVIRTILLTTLPMVVSNYWTSLVRWVSTAIDKNPLSNWLVGQIQQLISNISNNPNFALTISKLSLLWHSIFPMPEFNNGNSNDDNHIMLNKMIQRMQDTTEDDFLEGNLRRICLAGYKRFNIHFQPNIRWVIISFVILIFVFAGWIRYFLMWWDWKRRNRYRRNISL